MSGSSTANEASNVAANVAYAREVWGLSQRGLVEELEKQGGVTMSQTAIARIERGDRDLRVSELLALAKVFYTEPDAFMWEPDRFAKALESKSVISRWNKASMDLAASVSEFEDARKALLIAIEEYGEAWPASMRGYLRRQADLSTGEHLKSVLHALDDDS